MKLSKLSRLIGLLGFVLCCSSSINFYLTGTLDSDLLSSILEYPGNFTNKEEEIMCERMVNELTQDEQETAARTSYTYWLATLSQEHPSLEIRKRAAKKEARRHLVGERGNFDSVMARLRETCKFRKEKKMDLLRLCFVENANDFITDEEDLHKLRRWESQLQQEMNRQGTWVSADGKNHQAILHRSSRSTAEVDEEAYHLLTFYATERALAITELLSKGRKEAGAVVLYFGNYQSENMPPLNVVRTSLTDLQMIYPERITNILVLDPPRWLRFTYGILSMFLSKHTRDKVHMVSGKEAQKMESGIHSEPTQINNEINDANFLLDLEAIINMETISDLGPRECSSVDAMNA